MHAGACILTLKLNSGSGIVSMVSVCIYEPNLARMALGMLDLELFHHVMENMPQAA